MGRYAMAEQMRVAAERAEICCGGAGNLREVSFEEENQSRKGPPEQAPPAR
jgi:hypothetical protein